MTDLCTTVWCGFEQDGGAMIYAALIGLFGGLLALAGAIIVGRLQVRVLQRQTEIQNRQTTIAQRAFELEQLKVRVELFEKRFTVYEAAREFIAFILAYGRPPGFPTQTNTSDTSGFAIERQIQQRFHETADMSQFLFHSEVRRKIEKEIWSPATELHMANSEGDAEKSVELMKHFGRLDLASLFGSELELSAPMPTVAERIASSARV